MKKLVVLKKINGVMEEPFVITKEQLGELKGVHLCWNQCANAYADKCLKIEDIRKKNINNYPFITDGYQIIEDDGKSKILRSFIVTGCENCKKEVRKEYNFIEKTDMVRCLAKYYYGVDSIKDIHKSR